MFRMLNPVLSGRPLAVLGAAPAGSWIAVTSRSVAPQPHVVESTASVEAVAEALFEVVPVSDRSTVPLVGWLADASDDESLDAFFAFQGSARDAERRALEMGRLVELPEDPWSGVAAVLTVESEADFAFFVCIGEGEHIPAPLFRRAHELAA